MEIPIYTAADWDYRGPLRVMLASLDRQMARADRQQIHVLTTAESLLKFSCDNWGRYAHLDVRFVPLKGSFADGLPVSGHTGVMTFARLLLDSQDLCPFDRILYLDADILVRGNLQPLLDAVQGQGGAIAGVRECRTQTVAGVGGVFNWRELGLSPERAYINAGILGLRMDLIRRHELFRRALDYLRAHGSQVVSWDQGAINAVLSADLELWPEQFNFTTSYLDRSGRRLAERNLGRKCCSPSDAIIAHFTGSGAAKPWHVNSQSPFRWEYRAYMRECPEAVFPAVDTRLEARLGVVLGSWIRRIEAAVNRWHF